MKRGCKSKSVSDLLSAIHLENLTSVFVLNGYDSTDDFKNLSVDDLDYLGIDDHVKDLSYNKFFLKFYFIENLHK